MNLQIKEAELTKKSMPSDNEITENQREKIYILKTEKNEMPYKGE